MESNNKMHEIKSRIFDFFLSSSDLTQSTFLTQLQLLLKEELCAEQAIVTLEGKPVTRNLSTICEQAVTYTAPMNIGSNMENVVILLFDEADAIGKIDLHFLSPLPLPLDSFNHISKELSIIFQHYNQYIHKRYIEKQYEELYNITSNFHSAMKVESILSEVIKLLQKMYDDFSYLLLLTSDNDDLQHLPIKKFDFDDKKRMAVQGINQIPGIEGDLAQRLVALVATVALVVNGARNIGPGFEALRDTPDFPAAAASLRRYSTIDLGLFLIVFTCMILMRFGL
jgi:two-component system, cell cycle response regulator